MVALSLEGAPATMVGSWRAQMTSLLLVPFFIYQLVKILKAGTFKSLLLWRNALYFGLASLGGSLWGGLFFLALNYTSLAHAYLFNNILCIIIVGIKLVKREPCSKLELFGTFLSLLGGVLALIGGADDGVERDFWIVILGDAMAVGGSFGGVLYIYSSKKLRDDVPLFVYMLPISIVSSVMYCVLSILFEGTTPGAGPFDWVQPHYILPTLYLGLASGLFGNVGYIACLKYVPALVVTVVMLLEPVLGAAMGVIFGVTGMVDVWTIVGGCTLVAGTIVVTYSSFAKDKKIKEKGETKLRRGVSMLLQRVGQSSLNLFGRHAQENDYDAIDIPMEEMDSDSDDDGPIVMRIDARTAENLGEDDAV